MATRREPWSASMHWSPIHSHAHWIARSFIFQICVVNKLYFSQYWCIVEVISGVECEEWILKILYWKKITIISQNRAIIPFFVHNNWHQAYTCPIRSQSNRNFTKISNKFKPTSKKDGSRTSSLACLHKSRISRSWLALDIWEVDWFIKDAS